jgi:nucleoside-diphosphate-sugar epimerase
MKILLTGATGFIGKALFAELIKKKFEVSILSRKKSNLFPIEVKQFIFSENKFNPDFLDCLSNIECIIHLAAKAHIMDKSKELIVEDYKKTNIDFTLSLAKKAIAAGVKRFIFLSSIGVNGNQSDVPFLETDIPNPQEPYALSKYEAEKGLLRIAQHSDLEVVIIRAPLVYGKGAPGNFGRLIKWAKSNLFFPLPLGGIHNLRSLVAIENLVSFIVTCTTHKKASNEVFLISDEKDISTTELIKKIAKAFNKKALLLPIPKKMVFFIARIIGREMDAVRLLSSLVIDSSKARNLLEWSPVITIDEQLNKIIQDEKNL